MSGRTPKPVKRFAVQDEPSKRKKASKASNTDQVEQAKHKVQEIKEKLEESNLSVPPVVYTMFDDLMQLIDKLKA